jgi:hypothetical protein
MILSVVVGSAEHSAERGRSTIGVIGRGMGGGWFGVAAREHSWISIKHRVSTSVV